MLDLPQLHTKPTNDEISRALASLKVKPLSWNASQNEQFQIVENRTAVASYLTKIVASGLTWISNEEHRVELWETASRRLSERAGRFGKFF